jgi:prepilin signal peptidase PulO-like enzyme (type II secretory pathway)
MIIIVLFLGLMFGSFVNALVWRMHEQETETAKKKPNKRYLRDLSISKGRSMCPHCQHELHAIDLIPVISWLLLRGKCRYCHKAISAQYPLVELSTAVLFAVSYLTWPYQLDSVLQVSYFSLWLMIVTGFMALVVYDVRWYLLPNRIIVPLTGIASVMGLLQLIHAENKLLFVVNILLAVAVGGGIFYVLFQVSDGKWIGGGDVKLGWLLGLIVLTPSKAALVIFIAAISGTIMAIPLLIRGKMRRSAIIPFGPFLILGGYLTMLYGTKIISWYTSVLFIN